MVLTPEEVRLVIAGLEERTELVALLLYGGGLRLNEALTLRVKDVGLARERSGCAGKGPRTV
ncbi:MAG: tyrosine-type recombinase/integrase [Gemmatimonadales bacterium]